MVYRVFILFWLLTTSASAEQPFWPDVQYDPKIPSLETVLGHSPGERLSSPAQALEYIDALVAAAPERTQWVQYATSWNGRPLKYLVISSAKNMARLSSNKDLTWKLMDPRSYPSGEQAALVEQTLPVSWMSYGVHGDEISSTDAALLTAYHLLAAKQDATVAKILDRSMVVIDPVQNPDGRARFMAHLEQNSGLEPSVHYLAAEHRQAWPKGRSNHYLFDMNRDWFALTQPETRGRVKVFQEFFPVVHADVHEMGVDNTYYFPPPTPPYNPYISDRQKQNLILYGEGNASAFDDFDFDYFTRETFDAHYAGYGDTWPAFHGAVAMTFEAASARGLVQQKETGELVTYRDGVHQHFVASMATLLTTASHGQKLLSDMAAYRRSALEGEQHYLFAGDSSLQDKLMTNLHLQGIEVHRLSESTRVCGEPMEQGSYVVKAGQPAGQLVRTLLDANNPISEEFWQEKEAKRKLGLPVNMYDVLAWSLPALYGLEVTVCRKSIAGLTSYDPTKVDSASQDNDLNAEYGYLVQNDTSASMRFLAAALRSGVKVLNVGAEFAIDTVNFKAGTLLIKTEDFSQEDHDLVLQLARENQVNVIPLDSSWTTSGINFGSNQVSQLSPPNIAMAWDEPTYSTAAGATRFVLERGIGYPVTTVRTSYLSSREIDDFDVIVLPDGDDYVAELGGLGIRRLKDWTARGGVLITMGEATRFLIDDSVKLLAAKLEANLESDEADKDHGLAPATTIDSVDEYELILSESATIPDDVPGVIARGVSNPHHFLSHGVAATMYMIYEGQDIFTPLKQGEGSNVIRFAAESELLHGGYLWQENRAQLAYKPAVMAKSHGEGHVIGFVTDPTFRGFMDGFHVMLGNAVFKAPYK